MSRDPISHPGRGGHQKHHGRGKRQLESPRNRRACATLECDYGQIVLLLAVLCEGLPQQAVARYLRVTTQTRHKFVLRERPIESVTAKHHAIVVSDLERVYILVDVRQFTLP